MELPRDLGPQPLAERMAAKDLKPADLVQASPDQITHKMVARGMKGRRLTTNSLNQLVRAYNAASGETAAVRELFNYLPAPLRERGGAEPQPE